MLSTPVGKPISVGEFAEHPVAVSGVTSLGLATTVVARRQRRRDLPGEQVQRQVPRADAADHAERLAQRVVQPGLAVVRFAGELAWRRAAKKRRLLTARGISTSRASASGLPASRDSAWAKSSSRASSASARRFSQRARSLAGSADQAGKAARAAATAASTSLASLAGHSREFRAGRRLEHVEPAIAEPARWPCRRS